MTVAHIAGVPFEEWLVPLATTGTGITVALRAARRRQRRPSAVTEGPDGLVVHPGDRAGDEPPTPRPGAEPEPVRATAGA